MAPLFFAERAALRTDSVVPPFVPLLRTTLVACPAIFGILFGWPAPFLSLALFSFSARALGGLIFP
jgi:hypothetical protein